jgi:hypothetical protein
MSRNPVVLMGYSGLRNTTAAQVAVSG